MAPVRSYTNWNSRTTDEEEQIEPYRKYFFICEGANTETWYFKKLIDIRKELNIHPLIDIRLLEKTEGDRDISFPRRLIEFAENQKENSEIAFDKERDKMIVVFDGDIFEEFYYNLESMTIAKVRPVQKTYTIGDEIPVSGESYQYPDDFDIVILRERIFVQVRDRKVEKIAPLAEYQYSNVPVINGRGFAVAITSAQDAQAFLDDLAAAGEKPSSDFFNKWLHLSLIHI